MATFSNQSKAATATFVNTSANSATLKARKKPGAPLDYDEANIGYDDIVDPDSGLDVNYDTLGEETTYTNQSKS